MEGVNCCCNILWFLFAGWYLGLLWCIFGLLWCITIIGIPFGLQSIKIGCFIVWPFGKEIVEKEGGASGCDCLLNIIWFLLGGVIICICSVLDGILFCLTIVGIPFGLQLFKLATISCAPFGKEITESIPTVKNIQVTNIQLIVPTGNTETSK